MKLAKISPFILIIFVIISFNCQVSCMFMLFISLVCVIEITDLSFLLWGNCAFLQNFHTRKLGEITVFYSVSHVWNIFEYTCNKKFRNDVREVVTKNLAKFNVNRHTFIIFSKNNFISFCLLSIYWKKGRKFVPKAPIITYFFDV